MNMMRIIVSHAMNGWKIYVMIGIVFFVKIDQINQTSKRLLTLKR
jgi:hypothetical protein